MGSGVSVPNAGEGEHSVSPVSDDDGKLDDFEEADDGPSTTADSTTETVPYVFRWGHGGHKVYVTGTFCDWRWIPMHQSGHDFTHIMNLPKTKHAYKFIVDDEWRFLPDERLTRDAMGNINNLLDLRDFSPAEDTVYDVERKLSNPAMDYTTQIPQMRDFGAEPPPLPPHLRDIILNTEDPAQLPVPLHVSVNHLYCTAFREKLVVQGITLRYKRKFVTAVFYSTIPGGNAAVPGPSSVLRQASLESTMSV